jgi:nucleoside phosphorylase
MTSLPTLLHGDYTVGWICALPSEMAAARAMLDEHHNSLQQNSRDHNTYTLGRIGRHNVVLACLPTGVIGTLSAARVANRMLQTFEGIRFGLVVGIESGAPSERTDIRLGDIIIGKPTGQSGGVIQYDFGKTV